MSESRDTYDDIVAVIESAKARGGEASLRAFVAQALPEATEVEIEDAAELALEIIDSVPVFLARARQAAKEQEREQLVLPLLERAERYFLKPIDLIPEMTHGLPGLLDDSYLVIRALQHLDGEDESFLDWDLDAPVRFLRRLLGRSMTGRLDEIAAEALEDVSDQLDALWDQTAHRA
ncbi:MAG: hypothetical protein U5R14_02780 [Gemmatimonadota bacterium]|nr:hypothetical protein [Gemmatimonadota bacterium]